MAGVALCLFAAFPAKGETAYSQRLSIDGWDRLAWGATVEEVQKAYGISANTRVISQDDFKLVIRSGMELTVSRTLWDVACDLDFRFDSDGRLAEVSAMFAGMDAARADRIRAELETALGSCGVRSDGKAFRWIRAGGELELETGRSATALTWSRAGPADFPTPLFQAIDGRNLGELRYLLDSGANDALTFQIFEDEAGNAADATVLDYAMLLRDENPDDAFLREAILCLAAHGAPVAFFPAPPPVR